MDQRAQSCLKKEGIDVSRYFCDRLHCLFNELGFISQQFKQKISVHGFAVSFAKQRISPLFLENIIFEIILQQVFIMLISDHGDITLYYLKKAFLNNFAGSLP